MASVFKPTYLRPIPSDAKPCKLRGQAAVRFTDHRGKEHIRLTRKGRGGKLMMVCEQGKWWMRYVLPDGTEKRVRGYPDQKATEQEADRREREAAASAAGVIPVADKYLKMKVGEHLEEFISELERVGRAKKHYGLLQTRVNRMIDECRWTTLGSVTPDSLSPFLSRLKQQGAAAKTVNEYLNAIGGLMNWCLRNRRLVANPLAFVARADQTRKTYVRRGLTVNEARNLLEVAGPRRLIYHMALRTGLRRSELKQLVWEDLRIDSDAPVPSVRLPATITKARRADVLPLRQDLVHELLSARPMKYHPRGHVFPSVPKMETFKQDLERAGIKHKDASGRVVDFHALRLTLNTELHRAGVPLRTTMEILRHTDPRLSTETYIDASLLNTSAAMDTLPSLIDEPSKVLTKSTSTPVLFGPALAQEGEMAEGDDACCCADHQCKKPQKTGLSCTTHAFSADVTGSTYMVEAAGIEPASGCQASGPSTWVVIRLFSKSGRWMTGCLDFISPLLSRRPRQRSTWSASPIYDV